MTATSIRDISHTLGIRHRGGVVLRFVTVLRLITTSHLTLHCLCCDWGHVLPKCHFSLLLIFSPSSSLTFTDGTELATEGYEREYKCAAWAGGSSRRRGWALEGGPTRLGLLSASESHFSLRHWFLSRPSDHTPASGAEQTSSDVCKLQKSFHRERR